MYRRIEQCFPDFTVPFKEQQQPCGYGNILKESSPVGNLPKITETTAIAHRVGNPYVGRQRQHHNHGQKQAPWSHPFITTHGQQQTEHELIPGNTHGQHKHYRARLRHIPYRKIFLYLKHKAPQVKTFDQARHYEHPADKQAEHPYRYMFPDRHIVNVSV